MSKKLGFLFDLNVHNFRVSVIIVQSQYETLSLIKIREWNFCTFLPSHEQVIGLGS